MKRILKLFIPLTLFSIAILIIGTGCPDADTTSYDSYYPDLDQDGFGDENANPTLYSLSNVPANYVLENTDCDDTNDAVYPGATEIPDNLTDEDCNGKIAITFYADKDEDGFGNPDSPVVIEIDDYNSDDAPNGYSWFAGDCEDNNVAINPLADEILENGIDDNCDGETDIFEIYADTDGDGFGAGPALAPPAIGVHNNFDCDDTNAEINPYTKEIPDNGIDDNCDNMIDEIN